MFEGAHAKSRSIKKGCKHLLWDHCHADGGALRWTSGSGLTLRPLVGTVYVLFVLSWEISIRPTYENISKEELQVL